MVKKLMSIVLLVACFLIINTFTMIDKAKAANDDGVWEIEGAMPQGRIGFGSIEYDGKIYIFGGWDTKSLNNTVVYDPKTKEWETKANMPTARNSFTMAEVDGKIYIIGGKTGNPNNGDGYLSIVEAYDPTTDTWETKKNLNSERAYAGAATHDGKIYVFGGLLKHSSSQQVEEYDPVTDTWKIKSKMPKPLQEVGVIEYKDKIYLIGGHPNLKTTYLYDPLTDSWETKAEMPTARDSVQLINYKDKIYAIGGMVNMSSVTNVVEVYDPVQDSWSTFKKLNEPRWGFSAVNIGNQIYVLGGYTKVSGSLTSNIEVFNFDEDSNNTEPEPELPSSKRAILVITMVSGLEKEYDLTITEIEQFKDWYNERDKGNGSPYFIFNKDYNIGPFDFRKDHVVHEKIMLFEINEY